MTHQELIRAAIDCSGLSAREFAERMLSRDERTIRRWVSGQIGIPPQAEAWLRRWVALPKAKRTAMLDTEAGGHEG